MMLVVLLARFRRNHQHFLLRRNFLCVFFEPRVSYHQDLIAFEELLLLALGFSATQFFAVLLEQVEKEKVENQI
jgi:hypothetical protein